VSHPILASRGPGRGEQDLADLSVAALRGPSGPRNADPTERVVAGRRSVPGAASISGVHPSSRVVAARAPACRSARTASVWRSRGTARMAAGCEEAKHKPAKT